MMACQLDDEHGEGPVLTGGYVSSDLRGPAFGVADALLERVVAWAVPRASQLRLWVYEGSEPALRFYRRHGFHETGRTRPTDLPPQGTLWELAVPLTPELDHRAEER
jgi:GNAT superfamily N-acetyltransferase